MNLKQVRDGKYLHFPFEIAKRDSLWLGPGGIIDMDDPFIAKCAAGQEYKLDDAPASATISEVNHPVFRRARAEFAEEQEEKKRKAEAAKENEAMASIPRPDARPRQEKRNAPLPSSVSPGDPR